MPFVERVRNVREERAQSEQELHLLQEQFFAEKSAPAARVVRLPPVQGSSDKSTPTPAKSASTLTPLKAVLLGQDLPPNASPSTSGKPGIPSPSPPIRQPLAPNRRDVVTMPINPAQFTQSARQSGQPKKKSLFAQRREQQIVGTQPTEHTTSTRTDDRPPSPTLPTMVHNTGSDVRHSTSKHIGENMFSRDRNNYSSSDLAVFQNVGLSPAQIHQQSQQIIQSMSEEEILAAQEEIRSHLSPGIIAQIQQRNTKDRSQPLETTTATVASSTPTPAKEEADVAFFQDLKTRYFPALSTEYDKLAWVGISKDQSNAGQMADNSPAATAASETVQSRQNSTGSNDNLYVIPTSMQESPCVSLRFDFRGGIISPQAELPTHLGLHHHGGNPQQAGYTLAELMHLTRSAFPTQRVIPLRILANIILRCKASLLETDPTGSSTSSLDNSAGHYDPAVAGEILQFFTQAHLPLYLVSTLYESHRTTVVTGLDVIFVWLVPEGWIERCLVDPEAPLAPEDRLASQTVYKAFVQLGTVARLTELLGPDSPITLQPLGEYHALQVLWSLYAIASVSEEFSTESNETLRKTLTDRFLPSAPSESTGTTSDVGTNTRTLAGALIKRFLE
ncbi:hypothetical protein IWQ62_004067 [Dispira parvispora]|uniref:RNA polymerase II-associated protein 1 N-terminal domain-containing protein n=1 Tax=Dispira parvispora TaxID=1520584 RepID=A0A9W8AMM9_9FUNG|nr:hypothetical protein IWQ62_004067 [Dispira parvispora]